MNDFTPVGSWFDQKYKTCLGERFPTFKLALNLYHTFGGKHIVETGTTRMEEDWGAGSSTILFGEYVTHYTGHVWTVDISPHNIDVCRKVTGDNPQISYVVSDSLVFLSTFDKPIDLLYLDSYDFPLDGSDPIPCQEHQLKEFKLVEHLMTPYSVVLLDDNGLPGGGKTAITKPYLAEKGWVCLLDSQQSVWAKL